MVVIIVVVGAAAAAVYLPTIVADFVYDDISQIIIDDYIHKPAHFGEVLSFQVLGRDVLDNNRPVMLLSLMVDSMLWGRNPAGYHLTNILLHVSCTVLLFLLLLGIFHRIAGSTSRTTRPLLGALVGAILFAVHPANSEAVCVVSFREDVLVVFFTLIGLLLAERFPTEQRLTTTLLGGGCVLSILAAVASKESGIAAPPLLLMYWLLVRRANRRRPWLGLITAALAVTVAFLVARFALQPEHSIIFTHKAEYIGGSFSAMLRIQPRIWAFQIASILWPDLLCADQTVYTIRHINLASALVVLAIVAATTILLARKNSCVGLGAAFYWLALLPVSNLVPIYCPIADRYLYFPMLGVCLAIGAIVCRLKIHSKHRTIALLVVGAAAACSILSALTVQRTLVWKNNRSLWEDTVSKNKYSDRAYNNLGFALLDDGEFDKAVQALKLACNLSPKEATPWAGLAITYDALQKPALAEQALREAVVRDRRYAEPARLVEALFWKQQNAEKLQVVAERIFKQ